MKDNKELDLTKVGNQFLNLDVSLKNIKKKKQTIFYVRYMD